MEEEGELQERQRRKERPQKSGERIGQRENCLPRPENFISRELYFLGGKFARGGSAFLFF
jgi:hypothetical protein